MSHFFKRRWDEPQHGEHASWGCSWWYFETDDEGCIVRQVEVYDDGPTLSYDQEHVRDEFGMLGDQPLDLEEFEEFRTTATEFERAWERALRARR